MKAFWKAMSSLRLTVWLLGASMVLVFFGTLDQVPLGLNGAQEKYFQSIIAIWQYPESWPGGETLRHLALPIPGGYLIGPLLVLNLLAAHSRYFVWKVRLLGIPLIHVGILLFLGGQLATDLMQEDHSLWMREGETGTYAEAFHEDELVVLERLPNGRDKVIALPTGDLETGRVIPLPGSDLKLQVHRFHENAALMQGGGSSEADQGVAAKMGLSIRGLPRSTGARERSMPAAIVEVLAPSGSLGRWIVSSALAGQHDPQAFRVGERDYALAMRPRRLYLDFTLTLLDFTHDKYPGTDIPKNFASTVQLVDEERGEDRKTVISMNQPLRHRGLAFYQASFAEQDTASMLQVVRNPSATIPYIACAFVTAGLLWQFGYGLWCFMRRPKAEAATQA